MHTRSTPPRVLITRPAAQLSRFREQCQAAGFDTVSLPCIDIEFLDPTLELMALQQSHPVLFTSANAVQGAQRLLSFPWDKVAVCAIGPATERALEGAGQAVGWPSIAPYNSEALLERLKDKGMPETLTIIKGQGGREWLIEALKQEGVRVVLIDVYRRALPEIDDVTRRAVFDGAPIDIISVTSDEVLNNLIQLAGHTYRDQLMTLPLICNSQRCAELAASLGFSSPARVAVQPGDSGQLAQLLEWQQSRYTEF